MNDGGPPAPAPGALRERRQRARPAQADRRARLRRLVLGAAVCAGLLGVAGLAAWSMFVRMPGANPRQPLAPSTPDQVAREERLRRVVVALAEDIGERNVGRPEALGRARDLIEGELRALGLEPQRQDYEVDGVVCSNVIATVPGGSRADEIVVVGAHYDSVRGSPGANDNATGVAALIELARALAGRRPAATLRLVAFVNEEPPYFQTARMGSVVYAAACRARGERITAMLSLETMGFYSEEPGSQRFPSAALRMAYPDTGHFIALVGDSGAGDLVRRAVAAFRARGAFPCEGAALPSGLPGVDWSDHWSFRQQGYPALMVTDTAPFRDQHYHLASDTAQRLDWLRLGRVVEGVEAVGAELAGAP